MPNSTDYLMCPIYKKQGIKDAREGRSPKVIYEYAPAQICTDAYYEGYQIGLQLRHADAVDSIAGVDRAPTPVASASSQVSDKPSRMKKAAKVGLAVGALGLLAGIASASSKK